MQILKEHDERPIKMWTDGVPVEDAALKQLHNTAKLPFIHSHVAVMPDVHFGIGATVGSVIPMVGAVVPAAVGVDIGCGMIAVRTTLRASDLPDNLHAMRSAIEAAVPHGRDHDGGPGDSGAWPDPPAAIASAWYAADGQENSRSGLAARFTRIAMRHPKIEKSNNVNHLGTLGSGNHFIEVCLDLAQNVWVMLHSGSRGVGGRIGSYFIELAKEDMRRWFINLPDVNLSYLPEGTQHFADYVEAVSWAQDFALTNRKLMLAATCEAIESTLGRATSDEDFRGVAIAPREFYLGGLHRFDQAVCNSPDLTVFDLKKFVGLASQGNPNVLEILFVDDSDRLQVAPAGERLLAARDLFLSRRIKHTFSGYARAQLKRIDAHYRWLTKPPTSQPTRAEFKLPERTLIPQDQLAAAEAGIRQKLDGWSVDFLDDLGRDVREGILQKMSLHLAELQVCSDDTLWMGAARSIGYDENFIHLLDMEKRYTARKREWDQYNEWKKNRNPARAALEAKSGYDTKHGAHLVRLMRMCREILETGKVLVRRPDAAELLEIRNGAWTYDRLREWADKEDAALEEVAKTSPLPKAPDVGAIDRICVGLVAEAIR